MAYLCHGVVRGPLKDTHTRAYTHTRTQGLGNFVK